MNTNTNTNTNTTNNARIMTLAHELTRAAIKDAPADSRNYSATFSAALRLAWATLDAQNVTRRAASAADAINAEWDALTPDEQLALVKSQVRRAARDVIGYSVEDKYSVYWETPAFHCGIHNVEDYVQETFAAVLASWDKLPLVIERRALEGRKPRTLKSHIKAVAKAAVMRIYRDTQKHAVASVRDVTDKDGETSAAVETICAAREDVAQEAVLGYAVEQFRASRDDIDNAILDVIALRPVSVLIVSR